jgi:fatty acid desaturase
MHHTFTNVVGMDRDLGYGLLRMADDQPWHLRNLPQPLYAVGLMLLFEWGIAVHDIELDRILTGQRPVRDLAARSRRFLRKAARITFKDYVLFPALAGPFAPVVFAGNLTANLTRNVWEFATIFCGHFPSGVQTFLPDEIAQETRGAWYARQAAGSANIEGPAWLHVLCGHLSFQIEHHLFPDLPAHRYPEIAKEVEALCAQHGVPYAKGPFRRQLATAVTRILRCALPPARSRKGKETTPSPGPQPTAPGPMHRRPRAPWRAAPQAATAAQ